jgi:hypothetical protein
LKKIFVIFGLFTILSSLCWASGKRDQTSAKPVSPYWNGEGGKGMRLGIRVPESQGLNANQSYLPTVVQGVLVSNISKYSAIDVVDRISLDRMIAETLDPTFKDNMDIARLGHIEQPGCWMTGNIVRTSTGYTLQINVTDTTPNANTVASYNGVCTAVQLDDHSAIHQASLELLTQMGVQLTDRAKNELEKASTPQYVNAQSALSRGIVAQQRGTVVEALTYYYEATSFDPSVLEAAKRASVMTTAITSGNIGENVRNDIQRRNEWLKILREATAFFKAHPPYEIVYDPDLIEGTIDYAKETVDIYCNTGLRAQRSGYKIISDLTQGLRNTGKSLDWGLQNWPDSGETAIFTGDILNYRINAILVNEDGITIGRASGEYNSSGLSFSHDYGAVIFRNVNANAISDNLKVVITTVNDINVKIIGDNDYISISSEKIPFVIVFPDVFDTTVVNGQVRITGYKGTMSDLVIPSVINGRRIFSIGERAFDKKYLTNVTIPHTITFIGNYAFRGNQLTSITIPNSVTSIGEGAFDGNKLTSITIPNNVTSIGESAFDGNKLTSIIIGTGVTSIGDYAFRGNQLTSVIIPNSVTSIRKGAFDGNKLTSVIIGTGVFISPDFTYSDRIYKDYYTRMNAFPYFFKTYYDENGKKAGTYTYRNGKWNYSP